MKMTTILSAVVVAMLSSTGVQATAVSTNETATAIPLTDLSIQGKYDGITSDVTAGETPIGDRLHPNRDEGFSDEVYDALHPIDITYEGPEHSIEFDANAGSPFTLGTGTQDIVAPGTIDPQLVANAINVQFYGETGGFTTLNAHDGTGTGGIIGEQITSAYASLGLVNELGALVPNSRMEDPRADSHWVNFNSAVTRLQEDLKRINGDIEQTTSLVNGVLANI